MMNLLLDEQAQDLIEFALLLAIVAVALAAVFLGAYAAYHPALPAKMEK